MILKGLKFGMLLQLAIGPMCLFVFNTATDSGLWSGLIVVLSITLVDFLYVTLASLGISTIINLPHVKSFLKIFSAIILFLFGANIVLSVLGYSFIPEINLFNGAESAGLFIKGFLLTASNPLTIIFWSGVFSGQISENNYTKKQLGLFSFGCVLSTLLFLSLIAVLGSIINSFINAKIINILNIIVGVVIMTFGIKMILKKDKVKD